MSILSLCEAKSWDAGYEIEASCTLDKGHDGDWHKDHSSDLRVEWRVAR